MMSIRSLIARMTYALGIGTLLLSGSAVAAPRPRVVVLVDAAGATANAIGDALRAEVEARYAVDDARPFKEKLRPEWDGVRLSEALQGERRTELLDELRRVAAAEGEGLVVVAEVHADRTARSAHLALVGRNGEPFETTAKLKGKSSPSAEGARLYGAIDLLLGALANATPERQTGEAGEIEPHRDRESQPGGPRDVPADGPPPRRAAPIEAALFVLKPELGFGIRHFDYKDRVTPNQRAYDLGGAPLLGVRGELFPFARDKSPVLRALGIAARYDHSIGLESSLASATSSLGDGARIPTAWSDFDLALRARAPAFGFATVGGTLGYGATTYGFSGSGALAPELPAVDYRFVRLGADGRIPIGPVAVTVSADYLAVVDAGALSDRYPHLHSGGVDVGAGVAIPVAAAVELRSGIRYQRFFHRMNPEVGDANVAGGALDELARWDSGVAFHY